MTKFFDIEPFNAGENRNINPDVGLSLAGAIPVAIIKDMHDTLTLTPPSLESISQKEWKTRADFRSGMSEFCRLLDKMDSSSVIKNIDIINQMVLRINQTFTSEIFLKNLVPPQTIVQVYEDLHSHVLVTLLDISSRLDNINRILLTSEIKTKIAKIHILCSQYESKDALLSFKSEVSQNPVLPKADIPQPGTKIEAVSPPSSLLNRLTTESTIEPATKPTVDIYPHVKPFTNDPRILGSLRSILVGGEPVAKPVTDTLKQ